MARGSGARPAVSSSSDHCFCRVCGISPFSIVDSVPADYAGPARPGYYRLNLGCVDGLDVLALDVSVVDGRSF